MINKDKVKELVNKYLIEPCKQYETIMGPNLFIPARFDANIYFLIKDNYDDYHEDWWYLKICLALTKDEKAVFDDVLKTVKEKS